VTPDRIASIAAASSTTPRKAGQPAHSSDMPFDINEFKRLVNGADHGVFRSFTLSKSALRDLIKVLELGDSKNHRAIAATLKHIPADKRTKYRQALAYLESSYPGMSVPGLSAAESARIVRAGDDLTVVRSPLADTTDCVIFGHAGQVPDDPRFNGQFKVPFGLTLHFYTIHGQASLTSPLAALNAKPDDNDVTFNFQKPGRIKDEQSTPAGKRKEPTTTVTRDGDRVTTVRRDDKGTHMSTSYFERETPKKDVRDAKGVLVRDRYEQPVQTNGAERFKLKESSLQGTVNDKASRLLRGTDPLEGKRFGPTASCFNYVVKNGMGLHWADDHPTTRAPWKAADIIAIQDRLLATRRALPGDNAVDRDKAWVPHFVFVHSEHVVRLSDLITRAHLFISMDESFGRHVEHFYFAGCRGIHPGWRPVSED
jgi:hypothetical protein